MFTILEWAVCWQSIKISNNGCHTFSNIPKSIFYQLHIKNNLTNETQKNSFWLVLNMYRDHGNHNGTQIRKLTGRVCHCFMRYESYSEIVTSNIKTSCQHITLVSSKYFTIDQLHRFNTEKSVYRLYLPCHAYVWKNKLQTKKHTSEIIHNNPSISIIDKTERCFFET